MTKPPPPHTYCADGTEPRTMTSLSACKTGIGSVSVKMYTSEVMIPLTDAVN